MTRRLLNLLTVLSLLLCMGVCVLWVRSYDVGDQIELRLRSNPYTTLRLHAGLARLSIGLIRFTSPAQSAVDQPLLQHSQSQPFALTELQPRTAWKRLGFGRAAWNSGGRVPSYNRWIVVPTWLIAVLASALPTGWAIQFTRRRRSHQRPGICRSCGYDLTGNVSGVCPECGVERRRGIPDNDLDHAGATSQPSLPPLWQRVVAWVLVWVAAAAILLAVWPDLRDVLFMQR